MESAEDLQSNLSTYLEQLQQVKELLASDPGNVEYGDMVKELEEAIELTRDLLSSANSDLVSSIAEYQHELANEIPGRLPPGTKVQAVWTDDGEWYNATIESVTPIGYMVVYDEWGNKEEVEAESIRERLEDGLGGNALLEAERNAEATRQAIKRKIAQAADLEDMHKDLPLKLRIKPEDPEDVKAAKRKKIHAFKSKLRLEQMELVQNKRQNAWHQFQTNKGRSKKVGFFTGRKKESIFKSPDDPKGKVGVTGSGKGITEFHKREKHLHLKVGSEDGEE